ncbi:MAG: flavohemoprotein [Lysobacteraceae bacterium]|nr:MAG: flavohemoprotein [Xanthomonadaceae bacterium]
MAITLTQWMAIALLGLLSLGVIPQVWASWVRSSVARRALTHEQARLALQEKLLQREEAIAEDSWTGYRKFRLQKRVEEANDIASFYLEPHDGLALPPFHPGQHLTFRFRLPDAVKPAVRCYSLSNAPTDNRYYRISVKHLLADDEQPADGVVSSHLHQQLREGDIIDVRAPSGRFVLDELSSQPLLLIAGGVGITPLLSMIDYLLNQGSERQIDLIYSVRYKADAMMLDHFSRLQRVYNNFRLHLVVTGEHCDEACSDRRVDVTLIKQLLNCDEQYPDIDIALQPQVYLCGPASMMQSLRISLATWGVPGKMLSFEAFGASAVKRVKDTVVPLDGPKYSIEFRRSQRSIDWCPSDGSLLEFAEANGIMLDSGCRVGDCGTCLIAVLEGEVKYPDRVPELTLAMGTCLACIGKPGSDLVVDA